MNDSDHLRDLRNSLKDRRVSLSIENPRLELQISEVEEEHVRYQVLEGANVLLDETLPFWVTCHVAEGPGFFAFAGWPEIVVVGLNGQTGFRKKIDYPADDIWFREAELVCLAELEIFKTDFAGIVIDQVWFGDVVLDHRRNKEELILELFSGDPVKLGPDWLPQF